MSPHVATARRMLEQTGQHPVISLFFDLDPEQFATPSARATQARSLVDRLRQESRAETSLSHADRTTLMADLQRVEAYLNSDQPPVSGARALAVFCSTQDELFEAVPLHEPAEPGAVIARTPRVEPLVAGHDYGRWCLALVNRRDARVFEGSARELREQAQVKDRVHSRGGWSQANYERSAQEEADAHLRRVAGELYHRWQRQPFQTLLLGGPTEVVSRFEALLHNDLRGVLHPHRIDLDLSAVGETEVRAAVGALLSSANGQLQQATLGELSARLARTGAAVAGLADTLLALTERRVQTLVLAADFQAAGAHCPRCGLLAPQSTERCPVDNSGLESMADLREFAVQRTLLQDGEVLVARDAPAGLTPSEGIGALLRF